MSEAASFDAIMQCNLLEIFCEALGAALFVTDNRDQVTFASVRLLNLFPIPDSAIQPGKRTRDLYSALFDAGCRLGITDHQKATINRDEWIAERVAIAWRERVDTIEPSGPGRWLRMVSRRFPSGLGLTIFLDASEHKKKENLWRLEQERVRLTEEVLDGLPVAVAVRDHDLNFAAVNQKFCTLFERTAESFIGRGISDLFETDLAASLMAQDRALLDSGAEQQSLIAVTLPDGTTQRILQRARRIGRRDFPYIAMSLEDITMGGDGLTATPFAPDLDLRIGATAGTEAGSTNGRGADGPKKIIYCFPSAQELAGGGERDKVESCTVRSELELSALLPALRDAGLAVDLVVSTVDAGDHYAAIAREYGIPHMFSEGCNGVAPKADPAIPVEGLASSMKKVVGEARRPALEPAKLHILVVEDNPVNQLAAEQIFGSLGLEFRLAASGRDGLAQAAELRPALIFADVTLPDLSFDEFVQSVQTMYGQLGNQPKIVAVLSKQALGLHPQFNNEAIGDTIMKPLSPDSVDHMIRKHVLEFVDSAGAFSKTAA